MKNTLFLLVIILLVSCNMLQVERPLSTTPQIHTETVELAAVNTATAQVNLETPTPTTIVKTSSPIDTIPALTSTFTPAPTTTLLPSEPIAYYHLRLICTTTSDWSSVDILDPDGILTVRTVEIGGDPSDSHAAISRLSLNQPISQAEAGNTASLTVDLALAAEALDPGLQFVVRKGDIGVSALQILNVRSAEQTSLHHFIHEGAVRSSGGQNPKEFTADLTLLTDQPPLTDESQHFALQKTLWAFYYMWYTPSDWSSPWLQDHPLVRDASSSPRAIQRHIEQAQSAGIDGFISSWWGPDSDTDRNLPSLLDFAAEKDFKVSIYLETLGGPNGVPLGELTIEEWLRYFIQRYQDHPALTKVDGLPLIVVWASATVPLETWERVFISLRAAGLEAVYLAMGYDLSNLHVFAGLHEYGVFTIPDLVGAYRTTSRAVRHYHLLSERRTPKIWVATVQPGYDDTLQPSRQGLVQERLDGAYYRFTWEAALQSNPDWIFITSWNEWYEHTHIEPSERYGDQYLQITRQFADLWKARTLTTSP